MRNERDSLSKENHRLYMKIKEMDNQIRTLEFEKNALIEDFKVIEDDCNNMGLK